MNFMSIEKDEIEERHISKELGEIWDRHWGDSAQEKSTGDSKSKGNDVKLHVKTGQK